jgi:hypothetical protein
VEVAQQPALGRGEDAAGPQEVFQPGQQRLRARLVGGGQQFLGEPLGHGVRLGGVAGLGRVSLGLFLLEVTPMASLAQAAGADAMGTRGRRGTVFEPVNKRVRRCPQRGSGRAQSRRPARGVDGCAGRQPTAGDLCSGGAA